MALLDYFTAKKKDKPEPPPQSQEDKMIPGVDAMRSFAKKFGPKPPDKEKK